MRRSSVSMPFFLWNYMPLWFIPKRNVKENTINLIVTVPRLSFELTVTLNKVATEDKWSSEFVWIESSYLHLSVFRVWCSDIGATSALPLFCIAPSFKWWLTVSNMTGISLWYCSLTSSFISRCYEGMKYIIWIPENIWSCE